MSTVEVLSAQLQRYKRLKFHQDKPLRLTIGRIQAWQIQRMKTMHQELFDKPEHHALTSFLLNRLYNIQDMKILAQQLNKALGEHIKLDRLLPDSVRQAAEIGFQLAFITIYLDEQLASYFIQHGYYEPTEENMREASLELNHFKLRRKQLILLAQLSTVLHTFSKSILIQAAFKLAKRTAYRRGFNPLYDYLDEGFRAVKATPSAQQFFNSFITQEKTLLLRVNNGHPTPFQSMLKTEQTTV